MSWLPKSPLAMLASAALLGAFLLLAEPAPTPAPANVGCDLATAPTEAVSEGVDAITGGLIGGGNPVGDACNVVSDPVLGTITSPVSNALKGIGNGILAQMTSWVAEGASWLIGEVVKEIEQTTTPELNSRGFLAEYAKMSEIAALLGLAMLLAAVLEAVAQSSWAVLGKAFFLSVPLAFVGTSVAFAVVQLLLVATDAMSHAIAVASENHSEHFFKTAIGELSHAGSGVGGAAGKATPASGPAGEAAGGAAVPLFVTFLAAIVGAFAAFCVWIELLMRDAAVYVVALFMPMALAASIWPRWSGALRRTGELLVVVIGSKFVIVSIIALAAGLVSERGAALEHILAASALMLLACFAPFVLFKLVPFAEGALGAAYGRRSGAAGTIHTLQSASGAQVIGKVARSNWSDSGPELWSVKADGDWGGGGGGAGGGGLGGMTPRPGGGGGAPAAASGGGEGASATAATPGGTLAAAPIAATKGANSAAGRLEQSGLARAAEDSGGSTKSPRAQQGAGGASAQGQAPEPEPPRRQAAEEPPRPPQDLATKPSPKDSK